MKAVITVVGHDSIGIIAKVSARCADFSVNISDITQSVLSDYFVMIMIVDISRMTTNFAEFSSSLESLGDNDGLVIHVMHEDIFNSMHRI